MIGLFDVLPSDPQEELLENEHLFHLLLQSQRAKQILLKNDYGIFANSLSLISIGGELRGASLLPPCLNFCQRDHFSV